MSAVADVAERAVWTYIEALLGLWIVAPMIDLNAVKAAFVAALPAALAVVKGAVATRIGKQGTASTLPS